MTIDWLHSIIYVDKNDLDLIQSLPHEIRKLDVNWFHLKLRELEASDEGMGFLKTHRHNTEVVLGGVVYARVVEVIAPYTITFEDGQYEVSIVGGNSNILDKTNLNQVSVRSSNSAGLQIVTQGSGVTEQDKIDIAIKVWNDPTGEAVAIKSDELHRIQGLKAGEPMTVTPTSRKAGDIDLDISGDGETSTTVERK